MNIKDAAQRVGLPAKTIRYYEEIGLVTPDRATNGYRDFSDAHLHKLAFLAHARGLGFSIEDCRSLLALWEDQDRASGDVRAIATQHLAAIEAKIAGLEDMRATLADLVNACAGDARPDCPIIERLQQGGGGIS
ncbi:Cu(I)-responsive transcriptional regulator [Octadecabacter sp. G9-8]|uniref:Cu(I)-responsive transcriptional regulator n=1 Tax=Octadecabacter dasysiphoniae TaxID=2909341 RepID=A0ABS9CVI4_9RHOB|nr:Cu(I)-responsive transcriptional regulator [Octadecabacter dasysiphoniae]MCF2871067.1 Cu(I)-responsive transcriptional regulator [Octadecabacter dasysiphoniae]